MGKRTTDQATKEKLERERRARERFGYKKDEDQPSGEPDDADGNFGPSSELDRRRLRRDLEESGEDES